MDARQRTDDRTDAAAPQPGDVPCATQEAPGAGPLRTQKLLPEEVIDPASAKPATQVQDTGTGTGEDQLPKTHSPPEGGAAL